MAKLILAGVSVDALTAPVAVEEVRCQCKKTDGRPCNGFVTRARAGERLGFVRTVRHSSTADPEHGLYACNSCGTLHTYRVDPV